MYIPQAFRVEEHAEMVSFINENSFGILFSQNEQGPLASHLPFLLEEVDGETYLVGHMAKANPHWREAAGEVLVVFSGAHTYISPTWYQEPNTVPTWNYTAVHAYGTFEAFDDKESLKKMLTDALQVYESGKPNPWQIQWTDVVEGRLNAIVGFRIKVSRLEGKMKLSQNYSALRQERVVAALQNGNEDDRAVAELMASNLAKKASESK
jgi:transcriptional regulator